MPAARLWLVADNRLSVRDRELFLAEETVKAHVRQIFRKLGVRHRAHAVARGFRSGLID